MNRIIIEPNECEAGRKLVLSGHRARHILSVLKSVPGDTLKVGLLDGPLGSARVDGADSLANSVTLSCHFDHEAPERPKVDLFLALPRPKVLKRLFMQLAVMGVDRVFLTRAARVERDYFGTHYLDEKHYRPLLIEGLEQAGDTCLPRVSLHCKFKQLLFDEITEFGPYDAKVIAEPGAHLHVRDVVQSGTGRVLAAIGPEGGWNDFELDQFHRAGFSCIGMGPRILRSDMACISLLSLIQDARD